MKSNELLKISQEIILSFLKQEITDESKINEIANFLENFPVIQSQEMDKFLDSHKAIAEVALHYSAKNMMLIKTNANTNIENIMIVIHEYAHALSGDFSPSGKCLGNLKINTIFEEAMAVAFSEACINEYIINNSEMFQENRNGIIESSYIYPEERSILNTILFALLENNSDYHAMLEYLLGDKDKFYSLCNEQLGVDFSEIFSTIEREISIRNWDPNGYGFYDIKEIQDIYSLVSEQLGHLIHQHSLNGISIGNNDFTNKKNRYFVTSGIKLPEIFISILDEGFLSHYGLTSTDINDFLFLSSPQQLIELYSLNTNKFREKIIKESKKLQEWTRETGYTISFLKERGAKDTDIADLLATYDNHTGEKLNRKLRTEEYIKKLLPEYKEAQDNSNDIEADTGVISITDIKRSIKNVTLSNIKRELRYLKEKVRRNGKEESQEK